MKKRLIIMMSCMFVVAPAVFGDLTTTGAHTQLAAIPETARMCSEQAARSIPADMQDHTQRVAPVVSGSTSADN